MSLAPMTWTRDNFPRPRPESHAPGAWISIISAICIVLLVFSLAVRLYVRSVHGSLGRASDSILIAAALCAIVQTAFVCWAVALQFGDVPGNLEPERLNLLRKLSFATTFLYLVVLALSKYSVLAVYLGLTPETIHNRATYSILGLVSIWFITSGIILGTTCLGQEQHGEINPSCGNMVTSWRVITGFDIITEVFAFALSILLVIGKQMRSERKIIVVSAFGIRLGVVIAAVLRLQYITMAIRDPNSMSDAIRSVIWSEVQLHYSVVAAITYCWKAFASHVSTHYGSATINVDVYDVANHSGNVDYAKRRRSDMGHSPKPGFPRESPIYEGPDWKRRSKTVITSGKANKAITTSQMSHRTDAVVVFEEVLVESREMPGSSSSQDRHDQGGL